MSRPSQEQILDYFTELAADMRLSDWDFFYNDDSDQDTEPGDALAKVDAAYGRKIAWVSCFDALWELDSKHQRHTFVHELIHLIRWRSWIQTVEQLEDHLAPAAYDIYISNYKQNMEYEVDDLAAIIAEGMPLPPWTELSAKGEGELNEAVIRLRQAMTGQATVSDVSDGGRS